MKKLTALFAAAGTAVASTASFAAVHTAEIDVIQAEASANQSAVIGAVIAIAALSFGVGFLVKWLSR